MSVYDCTQSLLRIVCAAARLMASMQALGRAKDINEEIDHIQANLDHVRRLVATEQEGAGQ